MLDDAFNSTTSTAREVGFILLVFPFNQASGAIQMAHNGVKRESVIEMLKQQIERMEVSGEKVS